MNRQRAIMVAVVLALVVVGPIVIWFSGIRDPETFSIAIVSIVEIDPIVDLRKGFREEFAQSKFAKARKIVFTEYNAQGDAGLINQIADKVATEVPNVIYVLGTPAAQAIQKRAPQILLVQGAVTDPVAAGLADSWSGSGRKYIATSDLPPIDKQVRLIRQLTPDVKRLGVIYNPGEANSVAVIKRLREQIEREKLPLTLVERPIANSGEVATAVQTLAGKADALYIPPDNTAHSAIKVIGRFSSEQKLPLFVTVKDALDAGALATLSLDFVELGRESAKLTLEVLEGQADPARLPIRLTENPVITINAKIAASLRLDLAPFKTGPNIEIRN